MADKEWYYSDGDAQLGPISSPELKRLADDGTLKPDYLVWCEGMDDWQPAGKLKGLVNEPSKPPTPARRAPRPATKAAAGQPATEEKGEPELAASPSAGAAEAVQAPPAKAPASARAKPARWRDDSPEKEPPSNAAADEFRLSDGEARKPATAEPKTIDPPSIDFPESHVLSGRPYEAEDESDEEEPDDEEYDQDAQHQMLLGAAAARQPAAMRGRSAPAEDEAGGILTFLQLALWAGCLLAVLAGVPLFLLQWNRAEDVAGRTASAVTFLLLLAAVYVLVRAGERLLQLLAQMGRRK